MKEYEMLRKEILDNISAIVQYNTLLYTATIAVLAFAFDKESSFLCLLPYVAIIPIYLMVEERRGTNSFIASYMIVFLEGAEHNWETRLYNRETTRLQSKENKSKKKSAHSRGMLHRMKRTWKNLNTPARIPYLFISGCCSILAIYEAIIKNATAREKWALVILIFCVTAIAVIIMASNTVSDSEIKKSDIKSWQAVKAVEEEAQKRENTRNPQ